MELFQKYEHLLIEEVCRLCLGKKDGMRLISETGLSNMLLEYASIQIRVDDNIQLVCDDCLNEVSRWYVFKQQIIKNLEIANWIVKHKLQKSLLNNEDKNCNLDENNIKLEGHYEAKFEPMISKNIIVDKDLTSLRLKCQDCGKEYNNLQSLQTHHKNHISKNYECTKCTKVFKQPQTLADHLRRHYNLRNYACVICNKKFYKQFNVVEHMRIHTGERPFKCDHCDRTFTRALLLRNHIKKFFS